MNLQACLWISIFMSIALGFDSFAFDSANNDSVAQASQLLNSDLIQEWNPIESVITPGKRDYFMFEVNTTYANGLSKLDVLVFISGNLYSQPTQVSNSSELALSVWYSFDDDVTSDTSKGKHALFNDGYMEALATTSLHDQSSNGSEFSNLYLVFEVYNKTSNQAAELTSLTENLTWNYTVSISQYDLVFQWDVRSWIDVVDSDSTSALLTTGNVTTSSSTSSNYSLYDTGLYDLYLYSYEDIAYFDNYMTHSLRAVQNGPWLATSARNNSVNASLSNSEHLSISKSITVRGGSVKEQFYITGLNHSTTYGVFLTKRISDNKNAMSDYGGILFSKATFTTMNDDSCSLIFDLDFCDGVAYSVPTSKLANGNKTAIGSMYDSIAHSLYSNFSKALQMIPCDTEKDARFSPLRNCDDCASAYRNWLCAVTIPRCTTTNTTYYRHRDKTQNRNDFLNDEIQPVNDYFEILPCINMCYNLVADCPPDFQFSCPSKTSHPELLYLSYNVYEEQDYDTCNYVGSSQNLQILGS